MWFYWVSVLLIIIIIFFKPVMVQTSQKLNGTCVWYAPAMRIICTTHKEKYKDTQGLFACVYQWCIYPVYTKIWAWLSLYNQPSEGPTTLLKSCTASLKSSWNLKSHFILKSEIFTIDGKFLNILDVSSISATFLCTRSGTGCTRNNTWCLVYGNNLQKKVSIYSYSITFLIMSIWVENQ